MLPWVYGPRVLFVGLLFFPVVVLGQEPIAMSQEHFQLETTPPLPRQPYVIALIDRAKVAQSPKGTQDYSSELAKYLVSKAGKRYVHKFAKRLAEADLLAQRGEQKWVPENNVVRAFNEMMEQVSSTTRIRTNSAAVLEARFSLYNTSPYLTSVTSHQGECLPTEAVLLVWLLMLTDGHVVVARPNLPPPG